MEKMVKKSVITIVAVVLLVAIVVGASQKWGYSRYGAVYSYGNPYYMYAPGYVYPYGTYHPDQYYQYYGYPTYMTPSYYYPYSPLSTEYSYGNPSVSSIAPVTPQGKAGQLRGSIGGTDYGCVYGLVCDYTKTGITAVGVCSSQSQVTTYPYQIATYNTQPPYYYS